MQDEVNTKVVAIMIKGGKISAEVLKKALDKFVQEIEKAQKQMQQPKTFGGFQLLSPTLGQVTHALLTRSPLSLKSKLSKLRSTCMC